MLAASDKIVEIYQRHAEAWARLRGRGSMERPWLDRFLALVPAGAAVVDIGCGAAEPIARYIIEQGRDVVGIDSAPALIALCRERFPEREWVVGDMRTLSLDRRFAGILAWDSFFHLCPDDQRRMFPIFRRHAAPGAALMLTSGPSASEAIGTFAGEKLYHASLDPAEYRALLADNGFAVVSHVAEDPECGRHTIWLARLGSPSARSAPTPAIP